MDWTTGQHVHFATGYDRGILVERLLLASHANLLSHGLSWGVCSTGVGSLIHRSEVVSGAAHELYVKPLALRASREEFLALRALRRRLKRAMPGTKSVTVL